MKTPICAFLVAVLCLLVPSKAKESAPKIEVYSRYPGMWGEANTLICHVSGFHPPQISIDLLKNDKVITDASQTDLAFADDWHYHLTKHVKFSPAKGERFSCRVEHMGKLKVYDWEPDSE